jgi:hypothetical protein
MIGIFNSKIPKIGDDYFSDLMPICQKRSQLINLIVNAINSGSTTRLSDYETTLASKRALISLILLKRTASKKEPFKHVTKGNLRAWSSSKLLLIKRIALFFKKENNLREVILCGPTDGEKVHRKLYAELRINPASEFAARKILQSIFDYKIHAKFAYKYAGKLGINTCPYCNRSYIKAIVLKRKKGESGIRPTFDHFLPQHDFPALALNFYNLVPSCYNCNSSLKHAHPMSVVTHLHPYALSFGTDAKFNVDLVKWLPNRSAPLNFRLRINPGATLTSKKKRQIFGLAVNEGNINLFGLEEIYQMHTDVVGELLVRCDRYSNGYASSLQKMFGSLKTNKSEFFRFYFGSYLDDTDFHRRPLAKMTRDIVSQQLPRDFAYS